MTAMMSPVDLEKRNLESSILFMQQEHSTTLRALHEEISKLQKKCTELTFQLTMNLPQPDSHEEQQQKIEELIRTVKLAEEKQAQLNKELVAKDEVIKDMKIQARANEKRYLDEMRKKNQQVISLRAELDHKSGNIAYLTTEMHKLKVLQLSSEDIVTKPSRESSGIKSRRHKAMTAADIRSRPVTAKGQGQLAPDAEVFLAHTYTNEDRQSSPVSVKPTPPVLPPIQGGEEVSRALARRQQILRRRNLQSTPPEVSVLAVDKMASSSNTQVYEPHTTTD